MEPARKRPARKGNSDGLTVAVPSPHLNETPPRGALSNAVAAFTVILLAATSLVLGGVPSWFRWPLWTAGLVLATLLGGLLWAGRHDDPGPVAKLRRRAPLFWPGALYMAWALVQLLPLRQGSTPLTVSAPETLRGLAFVATAWVAHLAAAAWLQDREAHRRLALSLSVLGLGLAVIGLFQNASRVELIYGYFERPRDTPFFGPFWYRNHFAVCMAALIPISLGSLIAEARRFAWSHHGMDIRRKARSLLLSGDGSRLLLAAIPPMPMLIALVATTSRGGVLSLVVGVGLAAILHRSRRTLLTFLGLGLALTLVGPEALLARLSDGSWSGRLLVWQACLPLVERHALLGSGLNTFAQAVRSDLNVHERLAALHPHALLAPHSDYLQALIETGVPGLAIVVLAAGATLGSRPREPWSTAAVAAQLTHCAFDFDLQVPALALLLAILSAMAAGNTEPRSPMPRRRSC